MSQLVKNDNDVKNNLVGEISDRLNNFSLKDLSLKQLEQIEKLLVIDKAKSELKDEIKKFNFNYISTKNKWLKIGNKSQKTKKAYNNALKIFSDYLNEKGIFILDVEAEEVDDYINYLSDLNISSSLQRLYIAAPSSFFTFLTRWKKIDRNYFKGAKLPKRKREKELKVPTEKEIEKIHDVILKYKYASGKASDRIRNCGKWLLPILDLFIETGLRAGAIKSITVHQNNKIKGISKGKEFELNISKDLAQRLRKINLANLSEIKILKALEKACERAGTRIFSPHSFRHYFATKEYKIDKDIYRVSQLLNHSNIVITENYLEDLKLIKKK